MSTPGAAITSTSSIRPSVMVPVLSTTMLSIRCVASSTSPPLMTMPSCAPRPVPTMIAVGVARSERTRARDDQHRDRGGERVGAAVTGHQPRRKCERPRARGRSARRRSRCGRRGAAPAPSRIARPRRGARPARARCRHRRASPRTTSRPEVLTVAPNTSAPGPTSTGTGSPVSMETSTALDAVDDDARRWRSSRPAARRSGRRPRGSRSGSRHRSPGARSSLRAPAARASRARCDRARVLRSSGRAGSA